MTKALAQYYHARKRARERLGMRYTPELKRELVNLIQQQRLEFIEKQSNRCTKYRFWFNGIESFIIYDKSTKNIVTFLPSNQQETFYFVQFNEQRV